MQLRRLALGALALGIVLPATPGFAAAKVCKQIKDGENDAAVAGVLASPALDILSADVSSGKKEVTGTIRLKSADLANDNALRLGAGWNLNFTVSGVKYTFFARWSGNISATPELTGGLTRGNNRSDPPATLRQSGNDLVWSVPRKAVDGLKKAKQYIYINSANTGAASLDGDSALPPKPNTRYLDKTPSCLVSK